VPACRHPPLEKLVRRTHRQNPSCIAPETIVPFVAPEGFWHSGEREMQRETAIGLVLLLLLALVIGMGAPVLADSVLQAKHAIEART
jgi:hypothetical protein